MTPKLAIGTGNCCCGACGKYFRSVSGFDLHRTGPGEARRCLSEEEMREAGMSRNEGGWWITQAWAGPLGLPKGEAA